MTAPLASRGLPPLLAVDIRAVSLAEGVRAALSVAAIVALGAWVHVPGLMESALAALLTCLCDAGGPIRRRLPAILAFGLVGATITTGFGLLRNEPLWLVVPLASLFVFAAGFARAFGQAAMQVGNLLTVVLVLAVRAPVPHLADAATLGGMFLAGSAWALLLTMAIWRLHPYRPARRAVAEAYRAMAALAADLRRMLEAGPADEARWDHHARLHRRQVRAAIEQAREAVFATVRVRGPVSGRTAQTWVRLEAADQLFGEFMALSDLLAGDPGPDVARRAERMLRLLEAALLLLARAVAADTTANRPGLQRAAAAIVAVSRGDSPELTAIAGAMHEKLRVAITLSGLEAVLPQSERVALRGWETARANLHPGSEVLRHALRTAAVAAPALAATLHWPGPYEHWLTITLVLTMQPYFALTFTRAVERIGGTMLGGVLASGVAAICTTPLAMAAALFPLTVCALAVRGVSFGVFMALLTPLVVLLSELGRPDSNALVIAASRALFTLAGGGLALLASWLLWPIWEPGRLDRELRAAVRAHGSYAATELSALLREATPEAVAAARRQAGVASNNLEASLQRAMLEPRHAAHRRIEAALTVDAALRRLVGRLSMLPRAAGPPAHDPGAGHAGRAWVETGTARGASGCRELPPRPALPEGDPNADSLLRIAMQMELAASAAGRL